jgi:hypothetical protein
MLDNSNSGNSKKTWSPPTFFELAIKNTENGSPYSTKEDTNAFDPTKSP